MQSRTLGRAAPALALAVLLLAAPAAAAPSAPSPDSPPGTPGAVQLLADWWAGVTEPLVGLFAPHRATVDPEGSSSTLEPQHGHEVDPNGAPTAASTEDDPSDDPENRATVDPNG